MYRLINIVLWSLLTVLSILANQFWLTLLCSAFLAGNILVVVYDEP